MDQEVYAAQCLMAMSYSKRSRKPTHPMETQHHGPQGHRPMSPAPLVVPLNVEPTVLPTTAIGPLDLRVSQSKTIPLPLLPPPPPHDKVVAVSRVVSQAEPKDPGHTLPCLMSLDKPERPNLFMIARILADLNRVQQEPVPHTPTFESSTCNQVNPGKKAKISMASTPSRSTPLGLCSTSKPLASAPAAPPRLHPALTITPICVPPSVQSPKFLSKLGQETNHGQS
eukprot:TCALIF_11777-PA protein Name:"Protein of unknown function" AED:0.19 eAED:0.44 QI:0/-1/0/1/-1/1/1/0/225